MNGVKFVLDAKEVRRALAALPPKLNERVRKKAIRSVFGPARKSLRNAWRSAPLRGGKALHRKAIASATKLVVRRRGSGPEAPTVFTLGVQYGFKGGSKAKGRQRIYHLLENGFKHISGTRAAGKHISQRWIAANQSRLLTELQQTLLIEAAAAWGSDAK